MTPKKKELYTEISSLLGKLTHVESQVSGLETTIANQKRELYRFNISYMAQKTQINMLQRELNKKKTYLIDIEVCPYPENGYNFSQTPPNAVSFSDGKNMIGWFTP